MESQVNETQQQTEAPAQPWKQDFFQMFGFKSEQPVEQEQQAPTQGVFDKIWNMWQPTQYTPPKSVKTNQTPQKSQPSAPAGDLAAQIEAVMPKLVHAESRGKHRDKNGNLTTSRVGAKGITQVMGDSGRDPGYGVRPLQNDTEEEYLRFGRDLLTAYSKAFGGDVRKGLAAYNWGPRNLKRAIAKHGDSWESKAPAETKKYLKNIMGN